MVYLSNLPFFLAGGSDSLANIAAPPIRGQIAAALFVYVGLGLTAWRGCPGGRATRLAAGATSLLLLLLATHRVVVDGGRGVISDIWLLAPIQTMTFDQQNGPAATATLEQGVAWDRIIPITGSAPVVLFRGIPPLTLDLTFVEGWWAIPKP